MVYLDVWRKRSYDPTIEEAEYIAELPGNGKGFDVDHCWRRKNPSGDYEHGVFERVRGPHGENLGVNLIPFEEVRRDDPTFDQRILVLGAQVRLGSAGCSGWPQTHTIDTASALLEAGLQKELVSAFGNGMYWSALKELLNLQ